MEYIRRGAIFITYDVSHCIVEGAVRRDTAAPSIFRLGVSFSVSACGACRFILGVPFFDLV